MDSEYPYTLCFYESQKTTFSGELTKYITYCQE